MTEPEHPETPITIASPEDFSRKIATYIIGYPHVFGGADIYLTDYKSPAWRAGTLIAALFSLVDEEEKPAIHHYFIFAPPGLDAEAAKDATFTAFNTAFELFATRTISEQEAQWIAPRIHVRCLPDLRTLSVLDLIKEQPDRSAIIITQAALFRDDSVGPFFDETTPNSLYPEDIWAPQLTNLTRQAVALVDSKPIYVAVDANRPSPSRPQLVDMLMSIDNCGVMQSLDQDAPEATLVERTHQWDAWLRTGHLGLALQDVDALPARLENQKIFLKAQLLHRAGLYPQALEVLRCGLRPDRRLDDSLRVRLARIANDAGAKNLARDLIQPIVATTVTQEDLESALATAHEINAADLEAQLANRLASLFPNSPGLLERQRRQLLKERDYAGLATLAKDENKANYNTLSKRLSGPDVPDYHDLIRSADSAQVGEFFRTASVEDALHRRLFVHAFRLSTPEAREASFTKRRDHRLLGTLEALFLNRTPDGQLAVPIEDVKSAITSLIKSLANRSDDQNLRVRFSVLLQPSTSGTTGLALIASVVLSLASGRHQVETRLILDAARADWLVAQKSLLDSLFRWFKSEEPVIVGRTRVPSNLLSEPADRIVSAIADYIEHAPVNQSDDAQSIQTWSALGAAIAPSSSDPDFDLRLLRLSAGKLASAGFVQSARDLAEQALLNCTQTPRRRRLGWFAMADVYHRAHNYIDALLALACTFASDTSVDEEQAFQERVTLVRLLRDVGLRQQAATAIGTARQILERMGLYETFAHRLDTLELQIRRLNLGSESHVSATFQSLLADAVIMSKRVLSSHDQTEPIAAVLGQLMREAKNAAAPIPEDAESVLDELIAEASGNLADQLRAMQAAAPTADEMLKLLVASGDARYSDDVGFDTRAIALLASRALADDHFIANSGDVSFALEILADRGVAMPGWDEAASPPPPPRSADEPRAIARDLSSTGVSVVQAGWDNKGRMVRLNTVGGAVARAVREPEELIKREKFREWSTVFPYAYGIDEITQNLFYTTTQELRFSELPAGPVVVVSDVDFQAFPPNLLYVDDEFAGRTRPIAAAPSLAWLASARTKGPIGDGRRCAWISTADGGDGRQTLGMIAQRLESSFHEHGFQVDNGPELPSAFAGSSLAVIAAHGGIHPEGRYFQMISDEGVLRVSASNFAGALRNIGIVVLFVCSAGRADKHPEANTTLGLAKQILDRGCTAVIASPWPLDSRVPAYWLPIFMREYENGASLIEANFAANGAVDSAFALDPARGLAMTLFGDPNIRFLRRDMDAT